jgi:hypothetical protein
MQRKKIVAIVAIWAAVFAGAQGATAQPTTPQPLTVANVAGKWNVTGVLTNGELMPLDSDASLIGYMLNGALAKKKQKEGPTAILTKSDTTSTMLAAKMVLPMRQSEVEFKNKGKFLFSLVYAFNQSMDTKGYWELSEAEQTIWVSEKENDKNGDALIIKITRRGDQLILQMPDQSGENGYLLRKAD